MKKKYILTALAVMLTLSSCERKEENVTPSGDNTMLRVVMENCSDPTKTSISPKEDGGYTVSWNGGDTIQVNSSIPYYATSSGKDVAFKIAEGFTPPEEADPLYACYPSSLGLGELGTGTLPQTQTYGGIDGDGKVRISNVPAYAYSASANAGTLSFHNLCGVLGVKVTSDNITNVKSIRVSSNKGLCGAFSLSKDEIPHAVLTDTTISANFYVELMIEGGGIMPAADGNMFYITLPVGGYDYLKIELSPDGENYTQTMQTKANKRITIARNTVYPFNYSLNRLNCLVNEETTTQL